MVDSLRQSRKKIPEDGLILVEVLLGRGEHDQAVVELRVYLKVASGPEKPKARCWLAQLTQDRPFERMWCTLKTASLCSFGRKKLELLQCARPIFAEQA